jgi:hypothetical protein
MYAGEFTPSNARARNPHGADHAAVLAERGDGDKFIGFFPKRP